MIARIFEMLFHVIDGIVSLNDDADTCLGCLGKTTSIVFAAISAIVLLVMLVEWIVSLF